MNRHQIEKLLRPGDGVRLYERFRPRKTDGALELPYVSLSSIRVAIRERADDQSRSTDRSEMSRHSAVSAVVKPAK